MNEEEENEKLLEALKKILKKIPDHDKGPILYRISEIEKEKQLKDEFKFNFKVPRHVVRDKKETLLEILHDKENKIANNEIKKETGEKLVSSLRNQLFFLEKLLKETVETDNAPGYTAVTGLLRIKIKHIKIDPTFTCTNLEFMLDGKVIHEVKPDYEGVLDFSCDNSKEFEIIVHGREEMIISLVFCPVFDFVNFKGDFEVRMKMRNSQIYAEIEFIRDVKINKQKARILRIRRCGHSLEDFDKLAPFYCCVCNSLISFFSPAYRCVLCKFTCHKKCSDHVLFKCIRGPKEREFFRKGYHVPHKLKEKTSVGLSWCQHCGCRIEAVTKMFECAHCGCRIHESCKAVVFDSCGIDPAYRVKLSEYKPPPPVAMMPLATVTVGEFDILRTLGRGAFGKILLAKHRAENKIVALKIMKKQELCESGELGFVDLERKMLAFATKANHPFLVRMDYCFHDPSNVYLGMELMCGGDLFFHLSKTPFTHERIKLYAAEILLAIGFFHSKNIVYRDLKLDNVMVAQDGHIKLVDFGLCKDGMGSADVTHTYCGTPDTTAPEVVFADGYTKDCDWWSFGVILFEMYELESPFPGATVEEIVQNITEKVVVFTEKTPKEAQDLINALLVRDPTQRIGFGEGDVEDIKKHEYFKDIDWEKVYKKEYVPQFVPPQTLSSNFEKEYTKNKVLLSPSPPRTDLDCYFVRFITE